MPVKQDGPVKQDEPAAQGGAALPRAWYLDPDAFMRERRFLFAEAWQMIARAEALEAPGDYVCNSLAGLAVFVMKAESGSIGAFSNVCRHQGLPVLDAGAGRCALLRCRYHGWTYHFDGTFKEAPPKYAPADPASPETSLKPLRLAEWRGLLFVTASAAAGDLGAEAAPLVAAIDACAGDATIAAGEVTTDLQCNWKVAAEHFLVREAAGAAAADGSTWLWHFPTVILQASPGALVTHQLVARTHERSRIVSHLLVADPAAGAALTERVTAALADDKAVCEAWQAKIAEGGAIEAAAPAPDSALARFRERVRAAHGKAESG